MALDPEVSAALAEAGVDPTVLPQELVDEWVSAWTETGDRIEATSRMRKHPSYTVYFPGNKRDDGTVRYGEGTYKSMVEGYQRTVAEAGVDPTLFTSEDYGSLLESDVSVREFQQRVDTVTTGILTRSNEVRQFYASNYGIEPTDDVLIASVMAPERGQALIEEQVRIAQIGGAAAESGFDITAGLAGELEDIGQTYSDALSMFQQAGVQLPKMERLMARHGDPDDPFDLDAFIEAAAFADPEELLRIQRLTRGESGRFNTRQGFADRQGSLQGLVDR